MNIELTASTVLPILQNVPCSEYNYTSYKKTHHMQKYTEADSILYSVYNIYYI